MLEVDTVLPEARSVTAVLELGQYAGLGDHIVGPAAKQRADPALQNVDAIAGDQQQPVPAAHF